MNVANGSADIILRTIGIDAYELVGTLTHAQCRQAADALEEGLGNVRPMSESYGAKGAHVIDMGMSLDRLRRYAACLNLLADLAEQEETYLISYA